MAVKTNYEKNGYKYYRLTKTIGHALDGTAVKKEFFGKNKSEAEEKATQYINMIKKGLPFDYEKITIGQLMHNWLFNVLHVSKNFKSSSFERYESIYRNYVKDSDISILQVYNIKSEVIQAYYNKLYENNKTSSQIANLNKLLRKFFNYCIDCDYITKNPCLNRYISIPGNADEYENGEDEGEICVFEESELKVILSNLDYKKTLHVAILLASFTGLRMGEILGLKAKYLDLDNKVLKVKYNLSKTKVFDNSEKSHWELRLQKPKTKSSIRTVNIPNNLIEILRKYKEIQKEKYISNNLKFNEESLLFTTQACEKIDKGNFRRAWQRYLKKISINYKNFHTLRHTFASMLFKKGATVLEVKELLGHSDSKTTEKIYIYVFPKSKEDSVNKLNFLLD